MKKAGVIGLGVLAAVLLCGCNQNAAAADAPGIWRADYDAALKQAAAENKYVLVDFSGSDWCGWCIRLDEEVFSQKEFIDYASSNLVCVLLDFPRGKPQPDALKKANDSLAKQYHVQGFPTVLILNPKGKTVKQTGYQRGGAAAYVEMIRSAIAADQAK